MAWQDYYLGVPIVIFGIPLRCGLKWQVGRCRSRVAGGQHATGASDRLRTAVSADARAGRGGRIFSRTVWPSWVWTAAGIIQPCQPSVPDCGGAALSNANWLAGTLISRATLEHPERLRSMTVPPLGRITSWPGCAGR